MRNNIIEMVPVFSTSRMVREYTEAAYLPLALERAKSIASK